MFECCKWFYIHFYFFLNVRVGEFCKSCNMIGFGSGWNLPRQNPSPDWFREEEGRGGGGGGGELFTS